ncbi:hypothetical protein Tco_1395453, partial [Tanacetum coccineum]
MMLPAFVAWLPRLSLSSSVIPIRNVDWYMFREDVRSSESRAPCGRVQAMLPADRIMSGRSSIYTVSSVLIQRELDLFCSTYNISTELRPELPDRNSTFKNNSEGKIGMYTRFIEFANYRTPLSKFLLCILKYYQINLSQLSVIGAAKVNSSPSGFVRMSPAPDPPMDEAVELPCAALLKENRTLIRKYPETFLCLVGLSHSFVEMDVRPTLLHGDNEEMGLLNFVKNVDPFKVKTGEWTLAENEVLLLTATEDRVIAPSSQPMSLVDHTIQDELNVNSGKRKKRVAFASGSLPVKKARTEGIVISDARPSTAGKYPSALQRLSRQNEQASTGSGSVAPVTEDVISSSPTPTPDFGHEDASHDNVVPPVTLDSAGVIVPVAASTDGDHPAFGSGPEAGTLSATPSQGSFADDFCESQTIDSAAAQNIYASLRNQHDDMFLDALNVNSAQHVFMVSELRLRYEHEIMIREKFKKKFTESVVVVQQRDAEIVDLNMRWDTVGLTEKVSALELERDGLKDQVVGEDRIREEFLSQQDAAEQLFKERVVELDARIADVRRDMDDDLYPYMLTAIAGRRWVVGHGFRLAVHKCAKSIECQSALGKVISMAIN